MNILFLSLDFYLILTRINSRNVQTLFFFPFRNKLELLCWVVVTSSLATESGPFDALERPLRPKENIFFYY